MNKEEFDNSNSNSSSSVFSNIFYFLISLGAIYLSWTCESNKQQYIGIRIFYAILAFIFGIFYIIFNIFNEAYIVF